MRTTLALLSIAVLVPSVAAQEPSDDDWAAGVARLEAERARLEAAGEGEGPPRLERVDSEAIRWAFPRHRFYRIEVPLSYYKPGLRWAGRLHALERGKAEPILLCRTGHTPVTEAEARLAGLEGTPGLAEADDAVRFVRAAHEILSWFERSEAPWDRVERVEAGWRLERAGGETVAVDLDAEDRPIGLRAR